MNSERKERTINSSAQSTTNMGGLSRICKIYGGMTVTDANRNKVEWVYDYKTDRARLKKEMTEQEFAESEKAKYDKLKQIHDKTDNR